MVNFLKTGFLFLCFFQLSISLNAQIQKKVLVEKYTGAWCGNCPGGSYELSQTLEGFEEDEVILVYMHVNDVMEIPATAETLEQLGGTGVPKATADRALFEDKVFLATTDCEVPLNNQLEEVTIVEPSILFSYEEETRTINGQLTAAFDGGTSVDIRLGLILVEDNVVGSDAYTQRNYDNNDMSSPFYQLGSHIEGYVHRHVARDFPLGTFGLEGSIPSSVNAGEAFNHDFTYVIPDDFNEEEISLVVFVGRYDEGMGGKEILNAVEVTLAEATPMVTADFSANQLEILVGESLEFSSLSTNADQFSWDFGDGNMSELTNPTHTYTEPGTYSVSLTASNSLFTETTTKESYITVTDQSTNTTDLLNQSLSIQPNPTTSFFQLNINSSFESLPISIQVMDGLGRLVDQFMMNTTSQSTQFGEALNPGVYMVMVRLENGETAIKKVVKQ